MIDFDFEEFCCGCTSCAKSCPVGAIEMRQNKEGFLMPVIDENKCTDCGLCNKRCPYLNINADIAGFSLNDFNGKPAYLYYSNKKSRQNSASGGFVNDVFSKFVKEGGYVCGCVWDEELRANHIVSNNDSDLPKMQSSKYVQSDLSSCFSEIRELIKSGEKVAFCGTPCQTAGLRQYLGRFADTEQVVLICLICHGVPSPKVWDYYKKCLEKKFHARMTNVNMRDKSEKGYAFSYVRYTFNKKDNNAVSGRSLETSASWPTYLSDPYIFLFTDNLYLRNSCYHCKYKSVNTGADIIVGDFYASTPGAGNGGCSCLVAMTEKGDKTIKSLDGTIKASSIDEIGSVNGMICHSVKMHPKRKQFFADLDNNLDMDMNLFKKYLPFRFCIKNILYKIGLFNILKRMIGH